MVRTRWTIHDVELLPDTLDDTRYEIIDGELYVSRQPHYYHQRVALRIAVALEVWGGSRAAGETVEAPGVIFAADEAVAPDVVWVSAERLPTALGPDGKFHAAPDLIVEIISPGVDNERRDREAKLLLYRRRGVREYWIVDWTQRQIEVYRRQDGDLQLNSTLLEDDTLTSPTLPDFELSLSTLFAGVPRDAR